MTTAVQTIGLTKVLQGASVVNDVNLSVPQGSIYGIVGANGAGKTTLLRLLYGVMWPTFGEVTLLGESLPRESAELRQRMGHIAMDDPIYPSFCVQDLVRFSSWLYKRWDDNRCQRLLSALALSKRQSIRHLSLGMQMQLRLVIRLCAHPEVLLLDEPTNGLDPVVKKQFLQLILEEALNDGTTVLIATHNLPDLERVAEGVAVMYQGKIIADGLIDDFKARIRSYQVVLPNGLPEIASQSDRVLQVEQRGSVWTVVAEDVDGQIENALRQNSTHFEIIPQDLDDIFSHLLRKEGYSRDAILFA